MDPTDKDAPGQDALFTLDQDTQAMVPVPRQYARHFTTIALLQQSFQYLRDIVRHHYPHKVPRSWGYHINHLSANFRGHYVDYAYAVLSLQSLLRDAACWTSTKAHHVWHGGFGVDEGGIVRWSVNPDVPRGWRVLERQNKTLAQWQNEWRSYCRGGTIAVQNHFYLAEWLPRSDLNYVYLTLLNPRDGTRFQRRVHYVYGPDARAPSPPPELEAWTVRPNTHTVVLHGDRTLRLKDVYVALPQLLAQNTALTTLTVDLRHVPEWTDDAATSWHALVQQLNSTHAPVPYCKYYRATTQGGWTETAREVGVARVPHEEYGQLRHLKVVVGVETCGTLELFVMALQAVAQATQRLIDFVGGAQTMGSIGQPVCIALPFNIVVHLNLDYATDMHGGPVHNTGVRPRPKRPSSASVTK